MTTNRRQKRLRKFWASTGRANERRAARKRDTRVPLCDAFKIQMAEVAALPGGELHSLAAVTVDREPFGANPETVVIVGEKRGQA